VTDSQRACAATTVGAILGAIAGYMFFTERGEVLRRQLETTLDDLGPELNRLSGTVTRAAGVANESWRLLNDTLGKGGSGLPRYGTTTHQTNPF
jgi:hypothetical protein